MALCASHHFLLCYPEMKEMKRNRCYYEGNASVRGADLVDRALQAEQGAHPVQHTCSGCQHISWSLEIVDLLWKEKAFFLLDTCMVVSSVLNWFLWWPLLCLP